MCGVRIMGNLSSNSIDNKVDKMDVSSISLYGLPDAPANDLHNNTADISKKRKIFAYHKRKADLIYFWWF